MGWDGTGWMDGGVKSVIKCSLYFVYGRDGMCWVRIDTTYSV